MSLHWSVLGAAIFDIFILIILTVTATHFAALEGKVLTITLGATLGDPSPWNVILENGTTFLNLLIPISSPFPAVVSITTWFLNVIFWACVLIYVRTGN